MLILVFFHSIANGRKRKCTIQFLETEEGEISDMALLRKYIEDYYKKLFGREERGELRLEGNFWESEGSLPTNEAASLVEPFTKKEIKNALDDMNTSSTPGPDGLPVEFYKCFWEQVRGPVFEMFDNLFDGKLDLSRLNY
jgi:hypothetical protein